MDKFGTNVLDKDGGSVGGNGVEFVMTVIAVIDCRQIMTLYNISTTSLIGTSVHAGFRTHLDRILLGLIDVDSAFKSVTV